MKIKSILFVLIIAGIGILSACGWFYSPCIDVLETTSMELTTVNQPEQIFIYEKDSVYYADLCIALEFKTDFIHHCKVSDKTVFQDTLRDIQVITISDYNDNYKAGDNMANIIDVSYSDGLGKLVEPYPLTVYLKKMEVRRDVLLYINEAPGNDSLQSFRILVQESDTIYEATTPHFFIKH